MKGGRKSQWSLMTGSTVILKAQCQSCLRLRTCFQNFSKKLPFLVLFRSKFLI